MKLILYFSHMGKEISEPWKESFVQFVAGNNHLPVRDPVQNCDSYIFMQEDRLYIHVEGQGDFQIDVEAAAADYNAWVASHIPPNIAG